VRSTWGYGNRKDAHLGGLRKLICIHHWAGFVVMSIDETPCRLERIWSDGIVGERGDPGRGDSTIRNTLGKGFLFDIRVFFLVLGFVVV
jgi:hypothetical protein